MVRGVNSSEVSRWFDEYLDAYASCGRGESDTSSLLAYYGVPLLLTTDDGFFAPASGAEVIAAVQRQIDGMPPHLGASRSRHRALNPRPNG
jgi:hypothetical protein